jgi:hypothetical protein
MERTMSNSDFATLFNDLLAGKDFSGAELPIALTSTGARLASG